MLEGIRLMDYNNLKGEHLRRFIAVVAIAVTIYYLYWRITETFNPNALVFSWALWIAEFFGFVTTFLFYYSVWKPITRSSPPPLKDRTVDVLIPTLNESVEVLRKTILACNDLHYPHQTLILDDGNRPEVKALCEELKCLYLARSSHEDAKAGNVNFGLKHSDAEFIAIFDADHAPLPHFIDRLIGYFEDEKVAFVQAPQEFYNIDSFMHRVDKKKRYLWTEQGIFYSLIQPGRDHWNAAYFVGSCALMRRKALDDIGGFATGSITEDMMTSVRIHSKGWSSVYHHEDLAYGIAADTIRPFHIQRRRWGLGGWQVFFKVNPLFIRGLSFPQRICYLSSLIYPIEGFQKLIFYITPPIALITGVLPMRALDINYLLHFIPYYTISLYAFNEMGRGFGGNLMLEQFSMGKFATYLGSFFSLLLPKRAKQFKVTPKGRVSTTSYSLLAPQTIVFIISIVAIAWALVQLILQMRSDEFIVAVNSLWALYNSGLALAIILYAEKKILQRRENFRIPVSVPVLYTSAGQNRNIRHLAAAHDMTIRGFSLLSVGKLPTDQDIKLEIDLPTKTVSLRGAVIHNETIKAGDHFISRSGILFTESPVIQRDMLSRYLSESAISKFIREYSTRYETYLERTVLGKKAYKKRARRTLSHIPVSVSDGDMRSTLGIIKNISESGILLNVQNHLPAEDSINIRVDLETETYKLNGTIVRILRYESKEFPELMVGIKLAEPPSDKLRYIQGIADRTNTLLNE